MTSGEVCLCSEGVRGLESVKKTVSGRWNSMCERSKACLGSQVKARVAQMWGGGERRQQRKGSGRGARTCYRFWSLEQCGAIWEMYLQRGLTLLTKAITLVAVWGED